MQASQAELRYICKQSLATIFYTDSRLNITPTSRCFWSASTDYIKLRITPADHYFKLLLAAASQPQNDAILLH